MVSGYETGSMIVDLAAENGGNCELTRGEQNHCKKRSKNYWPLNIPSQLANHASLHMQKNIHALLNLFIKEKPSSILRMKSFFCTTITHKGEIISPLLTSN